MCLLFLVQSLFGQLITLPLESVCWTWSYTCLIRAVMRSTLRGKSACHSLEIGSWKLFFTTDVLSFKSRAYLDLSFWHILVQVMGTKWIWNAALVVWQVFPLASLEQGPEELVDPWGVGLWRGICSRSSSSCRRSWQYLWDVMVASTLGAFPGFGQLCSMTGIRKVKDLNVLSALFSPCECRFPVFQHEFHSGRTSLSCCRHIPCCFLVCNGRISYAFVVGWFFYFLLLIWRCLSLQALTPASFLWLRVWKDLNCLALILMWEATGA